MSNEELDHARAEEAWVIYNSEHEGDVSAIAARLAREGWIPPSIPYATTDITPDEDTTL